MLPLIDLDFACRFSVDWLKQLTFQARGLDRTLLTLRVERCAIRKTEGLCLPW